jgi:hypothetical protein
LAQLLTRGAARIYARSTPVLAILGIPSVFRRAVPVIGVVIALVSDHAAPRANIIDMPQPTSAGLDSKAVRTGPGRDAIGAPIEPPLKIQNIRLEAVTNPDATPSSSLKFDIINDGSDGVTNIVLEVSILKNLRKDESDGIRHVVVRPFVVRERVVLQPGHSMQYELQFRNLPADDDCEARVAVISAESLADSGSR